MLHRILRQHHLNDRRPSERIMKNRRQFLGQSAAAAIAVQSSAARSSMLRDTGSRKRRPNIVLILADDMGYSDIGCYGSEIATPHLDRLAADGIRFAQFYNSPRCCPSRAALMTGLYSHQVGMGLMTADFGRYPYPAYAGDLSKGSVTIAEVLRASGYSTFMTGKWHLSAHLQTTDPQVDKSNWPLQRGFERYYGIIPGASDYFDPDHLVRDNQPIVEPDPDFYLTDAIADNAVKFIEEADRDKPFFLYTAFNAPHWPLQAPEDVVARYRDRYMRGWDQMRADRHAKQIAMGLLDAKWPLTARDPRVPMWQRASFKAWEAERMAVYAAQVDIMDAAIGRIVAKLKALGQLDNTLILFMADNGGNFEEFDPVVDLNAKRAFSMRRRTRDGKDVVPGNDPGIMPGPATTFQSYGGPWGNVSNTPFRLYKHYAHEGGISTPLVVHWPAGVGTPGTISHQLGHEIDIMATCLAVSGAAYPGTSKAGTAPPPPEGRSLLPAFTGQKVPERGLLFWEHEGNCAVRDGKWKLVSCFPNGWELYDMDADRTEANNIADAHPDRVEQMAQAYEQWAKRIGVQPWPMPQTAKNGRSEGLPLPDYLKADRPGGSRPVSRP
jgi:arylsulfatase A-like enzyme